MTKPELGTKRLCAGCNAKFYDLHKTPIVCPTCETVFEPPKPAPVRGRRPLDPIAAIAPDFASPQSVPKSAPESASASAAGGDVDGDKEADSGIPLLEEIDHD